ncbi:phospholipase D-like domain-containing protein [Flavobacteriaceae bacterium M23B6Z8]
MELTINYKDHFPYLFQSSKNSQKAFSTLLNKLGKINGGILVPYEKETSEAFFVGKIKEALDRQIVFYLNQLIGNTDMDYLNASVKDKWLQKSSSSYLKLWSEAINASALHTSVLDLQNNPSFENYYQLFLDKKISFTHHSLSTNLIENELLAILFRLENHTSWIAPESAKNIFRYQKLSDLAIHHPVSEAIESKRNDYAVILFDSYYFDALIDHISNAQRSIDILMFYFALDRRKKSAITTKLYNALVDAHKRGVKVQVVLDRDKEDEKYNTREVNKNAIKSLRKAGINARFDSKENVVHSKVVVIDAKILFSGSHNFSISSSFRYEEVSIMLKNTEVSKHYKKFISTL